MLFYILFGTHNKQLSHEVIIRNTNRLEYRVHSLFTLRTTIRQEKRHITHNARKYSLVLPQLQLFLFVFVCLLQFETGE